MTTTDPTHLSHWRGLYDLLAAMDGEIERLYRERGIEGVRPRFAMPLIRLSHTGPLTITELATELGKTHSAISQTITAMRREGLVSTEPGPDARTRRITLTDAGRELVPFLEAEWRATEAAVAELESEIPYPVTRVVTDLEAALAQRPFTERIAALLQAPDVGPGASRVGAEATDDRPSSSDRATGRRRP